MKTIFVAIPSLDDQETIPTVMDAISKASNPERVVVGVSVASSNKKVFNGLKKLKANYPNNIRLSFVKITRNNQASLVGVGKGRLRARSLYQGEDYYLQIDSHSMFDIGWDNTLIYLHNEAKALIDDKVIITAYAGQYYIDSNGNRYLTNDDHIPGESKRKSFLYSTFFDGMARYEVVPSWMLNESETVRSMPDKFVPSLKFNANFAFGDKQFADNLGISEREMFFEEELIQTMELMSKGFSLVHPNIEEATVRHLYANHGSNEDIIHTYKRKNLSTEFYLVSFEYKKSLAIKNYMSYISDPAKKSFTESYQRYAGVNLFSCRVKSESIVPSQWKLDIFGEWPYNKLEV